MRYIVLCFAILTISACSTLPTHAKREPSPPQPTETNHVVPEGSEIHSAPKLEGLYFGTSSGSDGQRAWLFQFTSHTGRGVLYMPPNNLNISHLQIDSTGHLSFHSDVGVGGVAYSFDGQVNTNELRGIIHTTRDQPSSNDEISNCEVLLRKVDVQFLNESQMSNISGLYSNVEYSAEGGDLVGDELILLPNNGELTGIYTSYENEMIPYLALNITQSGEEIRFKVNTGSGEESFHGFQVTKKIKLWRDDLNADQEAEPIVLPKKRPLLNILEGLKGK